jgi:hypothetical protein
MVDVSGTAVHQTLAATFNPWLPMMNYRVLSERASTGTEPSPPIFDLQAFALILSTSTDAKRRDLVLTFGGMSGPPPDFDQYKAFAAFEWERERRLSIWCLAREPSSCGYRGYRWIAG